MSLRLAVWLVLWNPSFSTTRQEEFGFCVLSLFLPSRSINSPFFFELFAISSAEFAI